MKLRSALVLFSLIVATFGSATSHATGPAVFRVGFAVENIDPVNPQWPGGFGNADHATNVLTPDDDHLQVRAIAIRQGDKEVAMAIVDTQGWFSGNQEGPWGSRDARLNAATAIAAANPTLVNFTDANIVVSSTHSHAAPTIMGIWGPTDPVYLQMIHDQTVKALVRAADPANQRAANLYAGEADISASIISAIEQTDGYQGWKVDGRMPVLWARDPGSGATLGVYANVPNHADVVNGAGLEQLGADHIGLERRKLDADLGGTAVIAMGTLGRQESIIQVGGLTQARALASYVTNQIERALRGAQAITDPTVDAAQQYISVPATNPALAGLNFGNILASQTGHPEAQATEPIGSIYSIDRAVLPPYVVGTNLGTWITALRIGDYVYASEPGEAFPEVSTAIRSTFGLHPSHVRIVGMAQDQLGYYYPPETYPWTFTNPSDHHIYNSSLLLGEFNVKAHALNAQALGFTPDLTVHETSQFVSPDKAAHAGVQFFPVRGEGSATTFVFDVKRSESAVSDIPSGVSLDTLDGGSFSGPITWDFGDGSAPVVTGTGFISHTYAETNRTYFVSASVTDPDGTVETFESDVTLNAPPVAIVNGVGTLEATIEGGAGVALAAHWSFSDGSKADGLVVDQPAGTTGSVTVIDGAGDAATATF